MNPVLAEIYSTILPSAPYIVAAFLKSRSQNCVYAANNQEVCP